MSKNIIGNKGSSSEHVHFEAPDSLHSTSYARVLDLVSEGEILGLSEGLQSVYLNDTPVQNADGSSNFQNVAIDFRPGTQTQDFIAGFPDVENEVSVGVELKSSTPWVHAIANTALSAIRITLGVPALSQSDTSNGDVKGYKIDYIIQLSTDNGAYATVLTSSFNGKTTTAYQRTARIDLPAATSGWQVRVVRLTANANVATTSDATTVVSYTEVIDAKLRYPMSAIVGIQVDAKQFQSVPTRAYDLMGRIIQVPSNYNPRTRAYTGVWDGTFKPSWSDNPAWVFRDIALNDRYGLGHRLTAAQLDKWSLYAIARYCDELVPDGKGGSEPRFSCNVYLQAQKQAYAVLQDLASIFRGISYWGAGSIVASADMPADPVYVYTAANVIGGKFSRVGSSKKTRYTTALVSWNDPADMYKAKVEYVEDAEGITRYGIQPVSLTAFGCTSQGQAQRVGRWALATSRLETEMISFDVGMDGAIALPGQIVRVSDPARMGRRNGGRIKTASGRVVVLDKAPTIAAGDKLTAILPSGKSETHTVVSIAGDAVTVDADWTALPVAQSVWSVDSTGLIAPTYKVVSVTEKDGNTFTISATQHEPGKFAFIENGIAIAPRPESALNSAVQQPPAAVTVSAYTVSLQDVQKLGFIASCAAVPGATAYECSFQVDNSNWFNLPRQAGPEFDVLDVLAGNYTVRIVAVNSLGIMSIPTVSAATLVSKNANPRNADILLQLSAPGFNVNADGTITPASITVHATLLDLDGTPSFSAVGGSITSSGNNATVYAADMPGAAATVTATITALGQTFTKSIDIVKSADGAAGADNFMWVKYGTSAAGDGLTDNPAGMSYIGIAVNKSSPIESTVASDYTWSQIKGADGADGASTFTGVVFLQTASLPATPTGGSFNFTTQALTPPEGWSATQPASSTTPTWAVRYNFQAATLGATVTAGKWSDPVNVSQNGANGAIGSQTMLAFLYQWNAAAPAAPNGTSTLNWVTGANTNYNGTDNWSVAAPDNPGTPGLRLYVATEPVTAAGGVVSTAGISYGSATISAWSQNGNNGASGAQAARATVYQWAATIPAGPSGSAIFTWSTGLFGDAPAGWALTPGAPVLGYTLWAATVSLVDTATAATTDLNWSSAAIMAIGYAGSNGDNGQAGASYVTAYCASVTGNATSAPAATTGRTSLPADNSGGIVGTWSKTVPTLMAGQYQYQSDGIYDAETDQINWSIPYWSSLKVATLSAITANLGEITGGSINLGGGNFTVDNDGNLICRSATFYAADGVTVLFQSGVGLTTAGAAPGTLNSQVAKGLFINNDPNFTIANGWEIASNNSHGQVHFNYSTNATGATAPYCVYPENLAATGDAAVTLIDGVTYPMDPYRAYDLSASLFTDAGNDRIAYLVVCFYNSAGAMLGTSWGGTYSGYPWSGAPAGGVFTNYSGRFGANTALAIPAGTTQCRVGVILNYSAHSPSASGLRMAAQSLKLTDVTAVAAAQASASAAAKAASDAADVAAAAKARTDADSADNKLAMSEKAGALKDWLEIDAEYEGMEAQATQLGVSSTAYEQARSNLATYLVAIGPGGSGWYNASVDSSIDGPTYRNTWNAYYTARTALINAMAAAAATKANAANITGMMSTAQVASFLPPGGVTNSMVGGDLYSSNWNGYTDYRMAGWYLARATGTLYCANVKLNGAVMGGNWYGWTTPGNSSVVGPVAGGGGGFYCGPEGACWGNYNDNKYFLIFQSGDFSAPGMQMQNQQLTLTNTILIAPKIGDNMVAGISPASFVLQRTSNQQFTDVYAGNFTASMTNTSGTVTYAWSITTSSSQVTGAISSPNSASTQASVTGRLLSGQEIDLYVSCTVSNSGVSKTASATITVQIP